MRSSLPILVLLLTACTTADPVPTAPSGAGVPDPVEVVMVFDGDSFSALVAGVETEIRLLGINAPERDECWSEPARTALAGLLGAGEVTIDDRGLDRYGRTLAYVEAGGQPVNARLLTDGDALALTGEHPRVGEFTELEEGAWASRIGMWAPDACGTPGPPGPEIESVDADPPGPDDHPERGESAVVVNRGPEAVDLEGWTLRDESSSHRFVFEPLILEPGASVRVFSVCGVHPLCFGDGPVWSNGGDTALLLDPAGNVADRVRTEG